MVAATAVGVPLPKSDFLQTSLHLRHPTNPPVGGFLKGFCFQSKPKSRARDFISLVVASASTDSSSSARGGRFYLNFTGFPFPLGPFLNRRTIRTEVSRSVMIL